MENRMSDEAYFYEPDGSEEDIPHDATDHACEGCGEYIRKDYTVVLLQLVQAYMDTDVRYEIVFNAHDEPEVRPLFFHPDCLDVALETVAEAVEDVPPMEEPGAVLFCDFCNNSIRMGEKSTTITYGIVTESPRLQNTMTFVPEATEEDGVLICLTCTSYLSDAAYIEEWSEVSQKGECHFCMKARCWRVGRCDCPCHINGVQT